MQPPHLNILPCLHATAAANGADADGSTSIILQSAASTIYARLLYHPCSPYYTIHATLQKLAKAASMLLLRQAQEAGLLEAGLLAAH